MSIKEEIREMVKRHDYVSFVELSRIEGFKGKSEFYLPGNVVIWANVSEQAVTAINELMKEGEIHPKPASVLTYLVDGGSINLPIAKKPPPRGYKEPHWLPVTFCSGPQPDRDKRKK